MIELVQSVDRALTILEILANYKEGLGITDISTKSGLHKSTVHRLLGTLIYKGFVIKDDETNKYNVSLKLYELGAKRIEATDILNVSKPYTKELMKAVNETVHLVIRDGNDIIYVDKVEADNTIRMTSSVGKRSPLYCTSVGKAMLAFMPKEEVRNVWENSDINALTKNTITDFDKFERELEKIRKVGYAEDDEENEIGVRCIGAPVFNRSGNVEGAISISGPSIRVKKDRVESIAKEVLKYSNLISKELGYLG